MEFSITIAFTLKSSSLNDVDEIINTLEVNYTNKYFMYRTVSLSCTTDMLTQYMYVTCHPPRSTKLLERKGSRTMRYFVSIYVESELVFMYIVIIFISMLITFICMVCHTGLRCWLIHIAVDIGTSIIQERWHSIDNYLAHLTTVEQLYLTFLDDIVVCKLDIIGTEEAVADITLRKIFAPYHPKYTVLDFDTTQKV